MHKLSRREQQVYDLLWKGLTRKEVAHVLEVSRSVVCGAIYRIKDKGHKLPSGTTKDDKARKVLLVPKRKDIRQDVVADAKKDITAQHEDVTGNVPKRNREAKSHVRSAPPSLDLVDETIALRPDSCRWIYHDGDAFHYCKKPTKPGKSYCEEHCEVAYEPPKRKAGEDEDHEGLEGA